MEERMFFLTTVREFVRIQANMGWEINIHDSEGWIDATLLFPVLKENVVFLLNISQMKNTKETLQMKRTV